MRASDSDREKIASRLRDAHAEGRLSTEEFYDRLDALFAAHTYGELEPLVRDIPVVRTHKTPEIVKSTAPTAPPTSPRRRSGGDKAMSVMWTVWACAVSVNLVVWLLVSVSSGEGIAYFWPAWVAGPWGAVLLSISLIRRSARG